MVNEKAEYMVKRSLAEGKFIDQVQFVLNAVWDVISYKDYIDQFEKRFHKNKQLLIEKRMGIRL